MNTAAIFDALRLIIGFMKKVDRAISIDPEVFVKSDWPYLWSKK